MATIRPSKPCKKAGCHCDAVKQGYCLPHFKEYQRNKPRSWTNVNDRGYTYQWRLARKVFLIEHPLCVECGRPATDVDHIIPHEGDQALFWNRLNWQALCHECHSRKTMKEIHARMRKGTPKGE